MNSWRNFIVFWNFCQSFYNFFLASDIQSEVIQGTVHDQGNNTNVKKVLNDEDPATTLIQVNPGEYVAVIGENEST